MTRRAWREGFQTGPEGWSTLLAPGRHPVDVVGRLLLSPSAHAGGTPAGRHATPQRRRHVPPATSSPRLEVIMSPGTTPTRRRPPLVTGAGVILCFVGLTAAGGGAEMLLYPQGNAFVKAQWLDHIPVIDDWRVPGLVLGLGLGLGSLLTAYGLWRRPHWRWAARIEHATGRHWAWTATGLTALALGAWITLEVVLIPERSAIEALYAALAAALVLSWAHPSMRRYLSAAHPRRVASAAGSRDRQPERRSPAGPERGTRR
ncbi:hypothetical protein ACN27G_07175 [Plantactinospora sp. WMMB334]|uniref:hypothetical protein n=1 Tax=Plantactinospora sp. WMMB334 TaxID=3404119 RepID=UPI003B93BA4C